MSYEDWKDKRDEFKKVDVRGIGCKELIIIAQDVTAYGKDIYGKYALPRAKLHNTILSTGRSLWL